MADRERWRGRDGGPLIMGIVNVTPDSFSDGGQFEDHQAAIDHALELDRQGADILDIGGESTRPGAREVAESEEIRRVVAVIRGLKGRCRAMISLDSRKAGVMKAGLEAGADIVNDVSALTHDPQAMELVAGHDCPIILMHSRGDPENMQDDPRYEDVVREVGDYLAGRIEACEQAGIERRRLIADPGIGFGKTLAHNLGLLSGLAKLRERLGTPLLLGASRKRFIGDLSGERNPRQRAPGSIAAALAATSQGVDILRVHDVAATRQALDVWLAINRYFQCC